MADTLPETTREKIQALLASDRVVLFMKGTRRVPKCGFSAEVVGLLDEWLPSYATVDVLEDPELREAIKVFSDWPTIPQLYVDGEFIGGADIIRELDQGDELAKLLGVDPTVEPPSITITAAAAEQFRAAFESPDIEESDRLRLTIDARFRNDLSIGPQRPGDLELEIDGLTLLMDRKSARRASGLSIDYVETAEGVGFKIENPNAPAEVRAISVRELARLLKEGEASGKPLHLIDVRTPGERATAAIPGSVLFDEEQLDALPRDTPLYFYCHHGMRSQRMAEHFVERGFRAVYNVTGGIDAWSLEVDPSVPRY